MTLHDLFRPLVVLSAAAAAPGALAADPQVEVTTSAGTIRLELYPVKAPKTVENFLQYVKDGHYDGTMFHRVIDGFMIQGGGFDRKFQQKAPRAPVENEAKNGLKNDLGTIAMARTSAPHSASAQFFINIAENGFLDHTAQTPQGWGYCVFGRVVQGTDVVDKIKKVKTGRSGMHQDVPLEDVIIERAEVV